MKIRFRMCCPLLVSSLWVVCCGTGSASTETGHDTGDSAGPNGGDSDMETESNLGSDSGPMTQFEGIEEQYIISEADLSDICRVRYQVRAMGEPSILCEDCEWDAVVEKSNPEVLVDVGGACANSDLGLDDATVAAGDGERVAYGYMAEYVGHANMLMQLKEGSAAWEALTVANWNAADGSLFYDRRDGYCNFGLDGAEPSETGICGLSGEAVVYDEADAGAL